MATQKLPGSVAKKSAKKVATKAAKKVAKKAGKKGAKTPGRDMRRGYEHLHRIHVLAGSMEGEALEQVQTLAQYARAAFQISKPKSAADLLRAAEHLAFASMGNPNADESVPLEVRTELKDEMEHLLDRAATDMESQEPARAIRKIYKQARSEAKSAFRSKSYGRALEFARVADAVAHASTEKLQVEKGASPELPQLAEMVGA